MDLLNPETIPADKVSSNSPNGFPIATTFSPRQVFSEFPHFIWGKHSPSIFKIATSIKGSLAKTFAGYFF
jgi:hypothetical protein